MGPWESTSMQFLKYIYLKIFGQKQVSCQKHLKGQASTTLALPSPISLQHLTPCWSLRGTRQGVVGGQEKGHPGHLLGNQVLWRLMLDNAWRGLLPPNISLHPLSLSSSQPSTRFLLSWQQLDLVKNGSFTGKVFHLTICLHTLYVPLEL